MKYIIVLCSILFLFGCSANTERSKFEASDEKVIVVGCEKLKEEMKKEGKEADC